MKTQYDMQIERDSADYEERIRKLEAALDWYMAYNGTPMYFDSESTRDGGLRHRVCPQDLQSTLKASQDRCFPASGGTDND